MYELLSVYCSALLLMIVRTQAIDDLANRKLEIYTLLSQTLLTDKAQVYSPGK